MIGEAQSGPPKPRYGAYTEADRAELAVQVKAADFNGTDFDGRPFSAIPDWLKVAIADHKVTPNTRRHTDYADWDVVMADDTKTAIPGDWIICRERGDLSVVADADAFILINLRPPVVDENPEKTA